MCISTAQQVHFLYLASQVAGFVAVFVALAAVYGSGRPTLVLHSVFEAASELHKAVWLPKPCIRFSTLLLLAYD